MSQPALQDAPVREVAARRVLAQKQGRAQSQQHEKSRIQLRISVGQSALCNSHKSIYNGDSTLQTSLH